jgi:hypothetical protein
MAVSMNVGFPFGFKQAVMIPLDDGIDAIALPIGNEINKHAPKTKRFFMSVPFSRFRKCIETAITRKLGWGITKTQLGNFPNRA